MIQDARHASNSPRLCKCVWDRSFDHHRLLGSIGYVPPAEAEATYYQQLTERAVTA
ncbi:MAG TPA: hypothetical protein VGL01_03785 [Trinickia sp.]|jgi:hypothetical protein